VNYVLIIKYCVVHQQHHFHIGDIYFAILIRYISISQFRENPSMNSANSPLKQTRPGRRANRVKNFDQLQAELDRKLSREAQIIFHSFFLTQLDGLHQSERFVPGNYPYKDASKLLLHYYCYNKERRHYQIYFGVSSATMGLLIDWVRRKVCTLKVLNLFLLTYNTIK